MDILTKAIQKAVHKLSVSATRQIQQHAQADGWDASTASGLSVNVTTNSASISVNDEFADKAFEHEFGTMNHRPKATLRNSKVSDSLKAQMAILLDAELKKRK
jgi:hypothetical protein